MDALISNYYVSGVPDTVFFFFFIKFYLMQLVFIFPALAPSADSQFLFHPSPPQVKLFS